MVYFSQFSKKVRDETTSTVQYLFHCVYSGCDGESASECIHTKHPAPWWMYPPPVRWPTHSSRKTHIKWSQEKRDRVPLVGAEKVAEVVVSARGKKEKQRMTKTNGRSSPPKCAILEWKSTLGNWKSITDVPHSILLQYRGYDIVLKSFGIRQFYWSWSTVVFFENRAKT